jgi:hypothetical protein
LTARASEILLADADVLIDYVEADPDVLALCVLHFAAVHVMQTTLDEVDGFTTSQCERLGIEVISVESAVLTRASEERLGLSIPDTICLLVAEEREWTCVTNEKALRKRCDERHIRVRRGLNLMIELVRGRHLGPKRAEKIARAIQESNPEHIHDGVIAEFLKEIGL